jgi:hypothetical protein
MIESDHTGSCGFDHKNQISRLVGLHSNVYFCGRTCSVAGPQEQCEEHTDYEYVDKSTHPVAMSLDHRDPIFSNPPVAFPYRLCTHRRSRVGMYNLEDNSLSHLALQQNASSS